MRRFATLIACAALSGCGFALVHKIDIQQGNVVTPEQVALLKKGMTKAEVRTLLGTPLLTDVFHGERWDYYFSFAKGNRLDERTGLSVMFENERLASWKGDVPSINLPNMASAPRSASGVSVPPAESPPAVPPPSASPPLK
jgi:outer membrane protein assembly factor BamE